MLLPFAEGCGQACRSGAAILASVTRSFEVFARFLRLGCTSFGGPVAHLGYFRREFVEQARWLDDAAFAEIVALCSVLPGPTSTQVAICIGLQRAGGAGALLAFLAFALPSALLLTLFGLSLRAAAATGAAARSPAFEGALEGLAAAAAAVVLLAVVQLARTLVRTRLAAGIAAAAFALALGLDRLAPALQWLPLVAGGAAGAAWGRGATLPARAPPLVVSRRVGIGAAAIFAALLFGLPIVAEPGGASGLFATFFRAGSLVFGGGHVVLAFLQGLAGPGRIPERVFYAGYGAAQAVPGPLFTFAAFAGALDRHAGGWSGALVALAGIFAPSFLLLATAVPLWGALRELPRAAPSLAGIGAAVVGLLAAVFVDPIALGLGRDPAGIAIALGALALLQLAGAPAWLVVALCAGTGALFRALANGGSR
jgi:chromate transporter